MDELVRNHVHGQELRKLILEPFFILLRAGVECDNLLVRVQNDDGAIDRRNGVHALLNFAEFNSVTANFNLAVLASEEYDVTVRRKTPEITGLVNASEFWMFDEGCLCLFFAVGVTLSDTHAADVDFALDFGRTNFKRLVQNINCLVCERVSVRDALPSGLDMHNREVDGPNGCFGSTS